jgi:WD40 repeat protein
VWNSADLEVLNVLKIYENDIYDIKIFSDNQTLLACSYDKTVKLVDFQNKKVIQTLNEHKASVNKLYLTKNE